MTTLYFFGFLMWLVMGTLYFFMRKQSHLENKGKKNNAVYITGKIYLKVHEDNVIYSLYIKDKEISDCVLSYENGFISTEFVTIFGKIKLNRFTRKYTEERTDIVK